MTPREDVARFRKDRQEKIESAAIAQVRKAEKLTKAYRHLSASQKAHVQFLGGGSYAISGGACPTSVRASPRA